MMLFTCSKPTAETPETKGEDYPKPRIKTSEQLQIANFEQVNAHWKLLKSCSVE